MPKKPKQLTRPGDEVQRTKTGLEIPVPTRGDFFGGLGKAAKPPKPSEPSPPAPSGR
jgi:hypothetical protein